MADQVENALQPEFPRKRDLPLSPELPLQPEFDVAAEAIAETEAPEPRAPEPRALEITDLVRCYHGDLYRYAYRLTGSMADAEDLTQQAFLIAQRKLHQVREVDKVRGWLYAVLRSCFLKSCRKSVPLTATSAELHVDQIPQDAVEEELIDREQLQESLNQLPDEYRLVVLMFYFEDRSYKEIATALAIPIGTVMSRLARAKGRLRKLLLDNLLADEPKSAAGPLTAASKARDAARAAGDVHRQPAVPSAAVVHRGPFEQDGNSQTGHAPR